MKMLDTLAEDVEYLENTLSQFLHPVFFTERGEACQSSTKKSSANAPAIKDTKRPAIVKRMQEQHGFPSR
jgi:hypothetical protein